MTELEKYFTPFRQNILGINHSFVSPYGLQTITYADWTASGRCYGPIEEKLVNEIMPLVGNTHSECTHTGGSMTVAYHQAMEKIKQHVNAAPTDAIIAQGSGMTGLVNKLQRMMGLKIHEKYKDQIAQIEKPIVFVSHMEHHSNQTSWQETVADVEIIEPDKDGLVCMENLQKLLEKHAHRKVKIAAITSCSNVTGILTPYHQVAKLMHQHGGLCFVDFACSAPYININMHPANPEEKLDAIYFSPHKFLGGPATSGVLIFCKDLYTNTIPDNPGGGTVKYTNPWNGVEYIEDIEAREDGGTPGFLQTIKTALCIQLKEEMGVQNMMDREHELLHIIFSQLNNIPNVQILAKEQTLLLGVVSFTIQDCHYNLAVQLLNDRFGIQTRGGCSCAGTYGHHLLQLAQADSEVMRQKILCGLLEDRPGWIRMSIHPTTTNAEAHIICEGIKQVAQNWESWKNDYTFDPKKNEYIHNTYTGHFAQAKDWLKI